MTSIQHLTPTVVLHSDDLPETIEVVQGVVKWSLKPSHKGLLQRGGAHPTWGFRGNRTFEAWLLQGVPGVGATRAQQIVDTLEGSPYTMRVTREQLLAIEGVGPKVADAIIGAVEGNSNDQ